MSTLNWTGNDTFQMACTQDGHYTAQPVSAHSIAAYRATWTPLGGSERELAQCPFLHDAIRECELTEERRAAERQDLADAMAQGAQGWELPWVAK